MSQIKIKVLRVEIVCTDLLDTNYSHHFMNNYNQIIPYTRLYNLENLTSIYDI